MSAWRMCLYAPLVWKMRLICFKWKQDIVRQACKLRQNCLSFFLLLSFVLIWWQYQVNAWVVCAHELLMEKLFVALDTWMPCTYFLKYWTLPRKGMLFADRSYVCRTANLAACLFCHFSCLADIFSISKTALENSDRLRRSNSKHRKQFPLHWNYLKQSAPLSLQTLVLAVGLVFSFWELFWMLMFCQKLISSNSILSFSLRNCILSLELWIPAAPKIHFEDLTLAFLHGNLKHYIKRTRLEMALAMVYRTLLVSEMSIHCVVSENVFLFNSKLVPY